MTHGRLSEQKRYQMQLSELGHRKKDDSRQCDMIGRMRLPGVACVIYLIHRNSFLPLPRSEGGEATVFVQQLDVGEADAAEQVQLIGDRSR